MSALFSAFQAASRHYHHPRCNSSSGLGAARSADARSRTSATGAAAGAAAGSSGIRSAPISPWGRTRPAIAPGTLPRRARSGQVKAFNDYLGVGAGRRHPPHMAAAANGNLVEGLRRAAVRGAAKQRVAAHGADAPLCPRLCRPGRGAGRGSVRLSQSAAQRLCGRSAGKRAQDGLAIDMVPLTPIDRVSMMRKLCAPHSEHGAAYNAGPRLLRLTCASTSTA